VMAVAKDLPKRAVRVPAFHVRRRALHTSQP
jgi:hypothetical protein